MNWNTVRSLFAIGATALIFLPTPSHAGLISDGIEAWRRAQQPPRIPTSPDQPYGRGNRMLSPINRQGLDYLNNLGGGVDATGYYRQPIPSDRAFGVQLRDGRYEAPLPFDDQGTRLILDVQGGSIERQDFQWNPNFNR